MDNSQASNEPVIEKCGVTNIWWQLQMYLRYNGTLETSSIANNLEETVNKMAAGIHEMMVLNGFWDDQLPPPVGRMWDEAEELQQRLQPLFALAKLQLVNTELSEWAEAVRHPEAMSEHCPTLTAEEEEAADAIVRILDLAAARKLNVGKALIYKMLFNGRRPYKHGKLA